VIEEDWEAAGIELVVMWENGIDQGWRPGNRVKTSVSVRSSLSTFLSVDLFECPPLL
jgi:hypothetical protein